MSATVRLSAARAAGSPPPPPEFHSPQGEIPAVGLAVICVHHGSLCPSVVVVRDLSVFLYGGRRGLEKRDHQL